MAAPLSFSDSSAAASNSGPISIGGTIFGTPPPTTTQTAIKWGVIAAVAVFALKLYSSGKLKI